MVAGYAACELIEAGERQGQSPGRTAEHLRAYEHFEMVDVAGESIQKTGRKPYF